MKNVNKKTIIGEMLKDQAITNLEILYDELIGDDYLVQDLKDIKIDSQKHRSCITCANWQHGSCIHSLEDFNKCVDNKFFMYKEK